MIVCWTPAGTSCDKTSGCMEVFDSVPDEALEFRHLWSDAVYNHHERHWFLLRLSMIAIHRDKLDPGVVHTAMWGVPEYRECLMGAGIETPIDTND